MAYFVYILKSHLDSRSYVGSTGNVEYRLAEHNKGRVPATKKRRPLTVIRIEEYRELKEARAREKYLKSGKGREELKRFFGSSPSAKR